MFEGKEDSRFEVVYKQDSFGKFIHVLKDKETGVCYLYVANSSYGGGLSVMVDRDGKPITM